MATMLLINSRNSDVFIIKGCKQERETTTTTKNDVSVAKNLLSVGFFLSRSTRDAESTKAKVQASNNLVSMSLMSDGHMTPEEVERHLESRQTYLEFVSEMAPPAVPTEMFGNDSSLDSESNEVGELDTSPSNMDEDCLSVDMMHE